MTTTPIKPVGKFEELARPPVDPAAEPFAPVEPPEAAGRRPLPVWAAVGVSVSVSILVGALGFVLFVALLSPIQADRTQDVLYDQFREQLAGAVAPPYHGSDVIAPGAPVALLEIPGLSVRHVVVEGTASGDLTSGLGHRRDTALPGQVGVSLIYGRRAAYGGPFAELHRLQQGDAITVVTGQGTFGYRVDGVRRDGDPVPAPPARGGSRLTLITAEGRPFIPTRTLYVDASLVDGSAQLAPIDRPQLIPPYERAMRSDSGGVLALFVWLPALGLVLAGLIWVRHRIGRMAGFLMGGPLVLAVLWNIYEAMLRLLPNLL